MEVRKDEWNTFSFYLIVQKICLQEKAEEFITTHSFFSGEDWKLGLSGEWFDGSLGEFCNFDHTAHFAELSGYG